MPCASLCLPNDNTDWIAKDMQKGRRKLIFSSLNTNILYACTKTKVAKNKQSPVEKIVTESNEHWICWLNIYTDLISVHANSSDHSQFVCLL